MWHSSFQEWQHSSRIRAGGTVLVYVMAGGTALVRTGGTVLETGAKNLVGSDDAILDGTSGTVLA